MRGVQWWAKWYDPPGVPHQRPLGTSDKKEAQALLKEIEAKLVRGKHLVLPGGRCFEEILDEFLADKKARREAWTWKTYEKRAKHLRRLFPVSLRIGSIEHAHISAYLGKRAAEGACAQTLNHERVTLSTIFNWAIRRDFAEKNPAMKVEPYSVRPKHRPEIDAEDFGALAKDLEADIAAATARTRHNLELLRDAILTIWWSGLRIGEVARLRVEELDFKRETYAVCSAANKGPRIEPMHPNVKVIFERRCARAPEEASRPHPSMALLAPARERAP